MKRILVVAAALTLAAGSAFAATGGVSAVSPGTTMQTAQDNGTSVTAMNGAYGTAAQPQQQMAPNSYYNYDHGWNAFSDGQASDGGGN